MEVTETEAPPPLMKPTETRMKAGLFAVLFSVVTTISLPALTIYMALNCMRKNTDLLSLPQLPKASAFFSRKVALVYLGFVVLQAVLAALPVGRVVRGFHSQPGKTRLLYRLNGLHSLVISVGLLGLLFYLEQPVTYVCDNFLKLACTSTAFAFVLSVVLYVRALFQPVAHLSLHGSTGCTPYDFQHGREVNPRLGFLYDVKMVVLRTALVGWAVADISLTYKCYALNGCVYFELALAVAAQLLYILDLLYREEALLATATVMHDGLGFGLIHAACAICPFTFTVPIYYLVHHKPLMSLYCLPGIAVLFLSALVMNRVSLSSKMRMKRNPRSSEVAGPQKITTAGREKILILSGLWGKIRHPNYTSEILMFLAWTFPCGVQSVLPYIPVFLVLLSVVRRCFHVETIMARNYPEEYQQYKHRVPYRICPYVF